MAIYSYLLPIGSDGPSFPCLTGLFLMLKSYINQLVTITQEILFFPPGSLTVLMKIRKFSKVISKGIRSSLDGLYASAHSAQFCFRVSTQEMRSCFLLSAKG